MPPTDWVRSICSRQAIGFDPTLRDSRVPPAFAPDPSSSRHHDACDPRVPITRRRMVDHTTISRLSVRQITQKLSVGAMYSHDKGMNGTSLAGYGVYTVEDSALSSARNGLNEVKMVVRVAPVPTPIGTLARA